MKIIFDNIIFSLQKSGGISVYWRELINCVLSFSDITISFIEENDKNKNIFRNNLNIDSRNILGKKLYITKKASRYRKIDLKISNYNFIFHSSYYRTLSKNVKKNNSVKEVVTVHDFTYEYFAKGLKKMIHTMQKKKAIKAADVVLCISQNTKKDLLHFFPEFSNKDIRVVYNGVSSEYFKISDVINDKDQISYFLFVGSRAAYKNFDFCVSAISQQNAKYRFKIVGPELDKKEIVTLNKFLLGRWDFVGNVENNKLNQLYNNAFALLYPSSYEGFGIPIVEAMKAGCPFIALNASSIPEVSGDAGILLERLDFNLFNDAVSKLTKNRKEIVERGIERGNDFSWEKCQEETMKIYKELYRQ